MDSAAPISSILLIGDSLAVGLSKRMKERATSLLIPFVGKGVTSTRIDQWAKQKMLPEALSTIPPGPHPIVLVSLGTNDFKAGDAESRRPHVQTIIQGIRDAGAEPIWIEPPSMPFGDSGIRSMLLEELAKVGVKSFPSLGLAISRAADKIHPTTDGAKLWADAIWAWLPGTASFSTPIAPSTDPDSYGMGAFDGSNKGLWIAGGLGLIAIGTGIAVILSNEKE